MPATRYLFGIAGVSDAQAAARRRRSAVLRRDFQLEVALAPPLYGMRKVKSQLAAQPRRRLARGR